MDVYVVAEQHATGFERSVEFQLIVTAPDHRSGFSSGAEIAPWILRLNACAFDIEDRLLRDAVQCQIADDLPSIFAIWRHFLGHEGDGGVLVGLQKIRAFHVRIALFILCMQGGGIDAGLNLSVGWVGGIENYIACDAAESSANIGNH